LQPDTNVPPKRRSKEISLDQAGRIIASKKIIHTPNSPIALVRAAIRAGAKDLTIIPMITGGFAVDLFVAAGCVDTLYVSYIGLELFGFAPAFRRAAEHKTIKIVEADEAFIILGTRAAAGGMPFLPIPQIYEANDLPKLNPHLKRVKDLTTGEEMYAIPPLPGDVCIVHAQECDEYGNAQIWAGNQQEIDKAAASEIVIVSAERIVSTDRTQEQSDHVTLPGNMVTHVVHAPYGAHPLFSTRHYQSDNDHLRAYTEAHAKGKVEEYLARFVREPQTQGEYLERVGLDSVLRLARNI
jgi:glutaconate CoA-transferase, subunit A